MSKDYFFVIDESLEGERIDKCITQAIGDMTRSYIQKLVNNGEIYVNGKNCKNSYKGCLGDEVLVNLPESVMPDILAEDLHLDVIYEDDDVIVVNKPKDMVVHPAAGHYTGTLVNGLMYHCRDNLSGINGVLRPGIVHRIDKNTTGSVLACKNDFSHEKMALQFKEHSITREYRAIVHGKMPNKNGTIDAPIGRSVNDRKKMSVKAPNSKRAVTHYEVITEYKDYSYLSLKLETGRTHQIRVHLSSIGHPLLGDDVYGNVKSPYKLNGQCLHAYRLGFIQPRSNEYIETIAEMPEYFVHLLEILK